MFGSTQAGTRKKENAGDQHSIAVYQSGRSATVVAAEQHFFTTAQFVHILKASAKPKSIACHCKSV